MNKIKKEIDNYFLLMRSIPSIVLAFFVVSVVAMNILANKSITLSIDWLALDCGIFISWLAFLTMDMLVKRFGPKAATQVSITAIIINVILSLIFFVASSIPGVWGESYVDGSQTVINNALNNTFKGTWYVLFGSTIASIGSSFVNNFTNWSLSKVFDKNTFKHYAITSYISTVVAQFVDNMIFALVVSYNFFGWTMTQCVMCSVTGCIVELLCEIVFSPIGYKVVNRWKEKGVGSTYINSVQTF